MSRILVFVLLAVFALSTLTACGGGAPAAQNTTSNDGAGSSQASEPAQAADAVDDEESRSTLKPEGLSDDEWNEFQSVLACDVSNCSLKFVEKDKNRAARWCMYIIDENNRHRVGYMDLSDTPNDAGNLWSDRKTVAWTLINLGCPETVKTYKAAGN